MAPPVDQLPKLLGMLALPVFAMVVGVLFLRRGTRARRRALTMAGAERASLGEVSPGDGVVLATGEARPVDGETITAEIAGQKALVVDTRMEKPSSAGQGTMWTTVHENGEAVEFDLNDGTGSARVEVPDAAKVRLNEDVEVEVQHGPSIVHSADEVPGDPPPGVERYVLEHDVPQVTGNRRYEQGAITPGDRVHVVAETTEGPVGFDAPDVTLTGVDRPASVIVSDDRDVANEIAENWTVFFLIGGALFLVGALLSLFIAGVILS